MNVDRVLNALLTVSALAVAGVVLWRELRPPAALAGPLSAVTFDSGWRELTKYGNADGPEGAAVSVVQFSDFECPFCARFHEALGMEKERLGDRLRTVFIHYPLPSHRFARGAANAAECAAEAGHFEAYADGLFQGQDSLGLKSWASYAFSAGLPDTIRFASCVASERWRERVEQGVKIGDSLSVAATPTILINGWRFTGTMGGAELSRAIDAVMRGEKPAR